MAAQRQSAMLSLQEALTLASVEQIKYKPDGGRVHLLHLHGFKCAGTTLIWSSDRATDGQLAYL